MSLAELASERQNARPLQGVYSERFPATHIHGDFIYRRFRVNRRNSYLLRLKAKPFEDQLGYDAFRSPDEVRHNIREGGEVTFVMPARGKDMGKEIAIATREMRGGILVTGVVVVNEQYQKKGIATHLAEDAVLRHKPIVITGRTRRWEVQRTYESLEYQGERLIPVISPVDTGGTLPEEAQRQLVIVLTPKEREKLDLGTGLYPEGTYPRIIDLRNFPLPRNNPEGARIVNVLREMGIDPKNGRGFRYFGETDQDVLGLASAVYHPARVVILSNQSVLDRLIAVLSGIVLVPPAFKKA